MTKQHPDSILNSDHPDTVNPEAGSRAPVAYNTYQACLQALPIKIAKPLTLDELKARRNEALRDLHQAQESQTADPGQVQDLVDKVRQLQHVIDFASPPDPTLTGRPVPVRLDRDDQGASQDQAAGPAVPAGSIPKTVYREVRPHESIRRAQPGSRWFVADVEDGRLQLMIDRPPGQGWLLVLAHFSAVLGPQGKPVPGRMPTLDEIGQARYAFLPPDLFMAAVFGPPRNPVNVWTGKGTAVQLIEMAVQQEGR